MNSLVEIVFGVTGVNLFVEFGFSVVGNFMAQSEDAKWILVLILLTPHCRRPCKRVIMHGNFKSTRAEVIVVGAGSKASG